jgi:putative ABC transport system permease protein
VWMIALRDLQWRRRRFVIAVLATSLVLALTLLLAGAGAGLRAEAGTIVEVLDADAWFVAEGTSGPFTASSVLGSDAAEQVRDLDGVDAADPFVFLRYAIDAGGQRDVNVLGYQVGGIVTPPAETGRAPERPGEAVADARLGLDVGEEIDLGGRAISIVGTATGINFNFGTPTLFVPIEDVQAVAFGGQPLATSIMSRGAPAGRPAGLDQLTRGEVVADMQRPMQSGLQTVDFINALLWVIAAGIIGSILYLSALERSRDFAVLKAVGAANTPLLVGLALQAVVLALASAVVAMAVAQPLRAGFPFTIRITTGTLVVLPVVAVAIGLIASLAGMRRAVRVDPALAFGRGGG